MAKLAAAEEHSHWPILSNGMKLPGFAVSWRSWGDSPLPLGLFERRKPGRFWRRLFPAPPKYLGAEAPNLVGRVAHAEA